VGLAAMNEGQNLGQVFGGILLIPIDIFWSENVYLETFTVLNNPK
jgi:hypothetical protein